MQNNIQNNQQNLKPNRPANLIKLISIMIILIVLILFYYKPTSYYDSNKWTAVFLNNNQVYFGKIKKVKDNMIFMTDIYYLKSTIPLQQTPEGYKNNIDKTQIPLVKLGKELHGPEDEMIINKDYIVFIETLKNDSKIVEAINNFKSK